MEIHAFLTFSPPVHNVTNAMRRMGLSTLKLGIDPEGQLSLGPNHMNCLFLSLSYLESSLISSTLLLMENKSRSGCMCRREGSEEAWESDGLWREDFLHFSPGSNFCELSRVWLSKDHRHQNSLVPLSSGCLVIRVRGRRTS